MIQSSQTGKTIHIMGICGTFMGSLAVIAKTLGHHVIGCDSHCYPPMSTQLAALGIELLEGYEVAHLSPKPDLVLIGNAMSRGNPMVEFVLNHNIPYQSGPQWLYQEVLQHHWVLAAAGTHGKTTTASMMAWILECGQLNPGFLIGGIPRNFDISARLTDTDFFVIEADEYDSAFFDKRSKFIHYHPHTTVINQLEYDHADIFDSMGDIIKQTHHFIRTLPSHGLLVTPLFDKNIEKTLALGCWTPREMVHAGSIQDEALFTHKAIWWADLHQPDGSAFDVYLNDHRLGSINWSMTGLHNVHNALSAIAACRHSAVTPEISLEALSEFKGVKRRMEHLGSIGHVQVYDDFAHHPSAIATTLDGLRQHLGKDQHIVVLIEPRSATMRMGKHDPIVLAESLNLADEVYWYQKDDSFDLTPCVQQSTVPATLFTDIDAMIAKAIDRISHHQNPQHLVIMSNGGFDGLQQRLIDALKAL